MSSEPAPPQPARTTPPTARRIPHERNFHGDTFIDEYAWLADSGDPEMIAYLEAENACTEAMTAGQAGLRHAVFGEIRITRRSSSRRSLPWLPAGG